MSSQRGTFCQFPFDICRSGNSLIVDQTDEGSGWLYVDDHNDPKRVLLH